MAVGDLWALKCLYSNTNHLDQCLPMCIPVVTIFGLDKIADVALVLSCMLMCRNKCHLCFQASSSGAVLLESLIMMHVLVNDIQDEHVRLGQVSYKRAQNHSQQKCCYRHPSTDCLCLHSGPIPVDQ